MIKCNQRSYSCTYLRFFTSSWKNHPFFNIYNKLKRKQHFIDLNCCCCYPKTTFIELTINFRKNHCEITINRYKSTENMHTFLKHFLLWKTILIHCTNFHEISFSLKMYIIQNLEKVFFLIIWYLKWSQIKIEVFLYK